MASSFWDYRARQADQEAAKKCSPVDLEKTQEVNVIESDLSNTAVIRIRDAIMRKWRGER